MKNRKLSGAPRRGGPVACLKRHWGSYLLVAPFMLIFLVFTVAPVFVTLIISFTKYSVLEAPVFVGLDNYKQLFLNDKVFAQAVKNTPGLRHLHRAGGICALVLSLLGD